MDFFAVFCYTDRRNCEINFSARFFIMLGLGTIINCAGILLGGFFGLFAGRCGHPERQEALQKACGIAVLFIGISGAMAGMLQVGGSALSSGKAMLVALSLALGTVLGELLSLEAWFARLGKWLRDKTGSSGDPRFIDAFVTASLTVCIGAMSIVGAIEDGVSRDYSTLAVKAVLDCVIIAEKYPAMVHSGVYIGVTGPNYETPAEIRAFRTMGADAVGMSTVPEVLVARQLGLRVCGISLISNMAAGVLDQKLTEEEVFEAGRRAQPVFSAMVGEFIREIGGAQ